MSRQEQLKSRKSGKSQKSGKTFAPAASPLFWCPACNLPLLSDHCDSCGSTGRPVPLSPPGDIRLCSPAAQKSLQNLFLDSFGFSGFIDGRIILLNKIAGMDRRDQVILDGRHIATMWYDITFSRLRLDLEIAGAGLIADRACKGLALCNASLLKAHLKGKWIEQEGIVDLKGALVEGDPVVLRIGERYGCGVVRRRGSGSLAIRVKDLGGGVVRPHKRRPGVDEVIKANRNHLLRLERSAIRELKGAVSKFGLPINVSFSGGKDSLAALSLALEVMPGAEVLFIDTGLEFPETVEYVHKTASSLGLRLHVIAGEDASKGFFDQVEVFGPPAKDFRWCCKTRKLGPLTTFIQSHYPKGCLTVEGRRIYESFNRSRIGLVEKNPYVPGQITLSPIRNWRNLEVVLYIRQRGMELNPLYDRDYERIGCWLCPASLQSELQNTLRTHPDLHSRWTSILFRWARANGLDDRYVTWGFWRWRSHPAKVSEMARAHNIGLQISPNLDGKLGLDVVVGRSLCGIEHTIDAKLSLPSNHPFGAVAGAMSMLGDVKYMESLGAVTIKAATGRATVFASGHIVVVADESHAKELLRQIVQTAVRVQTCTRCRICEKRCKNNAIEVSSTIDVDEMLCNQCLRCLDGCIAASQGLKLFKEEKS